MSKSGYIKAFKIVKMGLLQIFKKTAPLSLLYLTSKSTHFRKQSNHLKNPTFTIFTNTLVIPLKSPMPSCIQSDQ